MRSRCDVCNMYALSTCRRQDALNEGLMCNLSTGQQRTRPLRDRNGSCTQAWLRRPPSRQELEVVLAPSGSKLAHVLKWCTVAGPTGVQNSRPIILITTVDIGEGRTDQIKLREGDSPQVRCMLCRNACSLLKYCCAVICSSMKFEYPVCAWRCSSADAPC